MKTSVMARSADRFIIDPFEPAYRSRADGAGLSEKAAAAVESLRCCRVCPRECGADRLTNQTSFCGGGRYARVASAGPHHGEEECLRGRGGSGTIFFAGCNLRCVFCQNQDISQGSSGNELRADEIAQIALKLQDAGCHNINLVTPTHVLPQVMEAMAAAIDMGLRIPIVYNTGGYESVASLRMMEGIVDIYMPDFKLWTTGSAGRYLNARDYPERARDAVAEMHRQVGDLRFGPDGLARRGLLVRHLVMPGMLDETAAILRWLADSLSRDTFVNIMGQYHPDNKVGRRSRPGRPDARCDYAEIDRRPTGDELRAAYEAAAAAGLWRFDG